jgi:hypothetical protein
VNRFLILASVGIAFSAPTSAQTPQKPIPRAQYLQIVDGRFSAADTNHDGYVTAAEIEAQRQRDLQQVKANMAKQLQDAFKRLDTNHDGKLTLDEFMASAPTVKSTETPQEMIARLDTNHDGKISADEFRNPEIAKFNRVDANHDGIVTPQEQQAAAGKK